MNRYTVFLLYIRLGCADMRIYARILQTRAAMISVAVLIGHYRAYVRLPVSHRGLIGVISSRGMQDIRSGYLSARNDPSVDWMAFRRVSLLAASGYLCHSVASHIWGFIGSIEIYKRQS